MFADPEQAADLLADVFAKGGVLDEVHQVLTVTKDLIRDELSLDRWSEDDPGYTLFHLLADAGEHLRGRTQELRGAPQILRELPGCGSPAAPTAPSAPRHEPVQQPVPDAASQARHTRAPDPPALPAPVPGQPLRRSPR
jgi:hypothetical protein